MRLAVLLTTAAVAACSFDRGAAEPDAAAPECGEVETRCFGEGAEAVVQRCGPDGWNVVQSCLLGCADTSEGALCVAPGQLSNGLEPGDLGGASGVLEIEEDAVVVANTDTGQIFSCTAIKDLRPAGPGAAGGVGFQSRPQSDAGDGADGTPDLGLFTMDGLVVGSGARLHFVGNNAAALLVGRNAEIHGSIIVSAGPLACDIISTCAGGGFAPNIRCGGPGAGEGGVENIDGAGTDASRGGGPGGGGLGPSTTTTDAELGGGGGGHLAEGGDGGGATNAGAGYGNPRLTPLLGGSGGGGGGRSGAAQTAGQGGGGGGALQLSAIGDIHLYADGSILCAGEGGGGVVGLENNGAGGGGSGGAALLEGSNLAIEGVVACNGGGGGGGAGVFLGVGTAGESGQPSAERATGGDGNSAGGAGGAAATPAGDDGGATPTDGTGGGGGAAGRILLRSGPDAVTVAPGSVLSPPPTVAADL